MRGLLRTAFALWVFTSVSAVVAAPYSDDYPEPAWFQLSPELSDGPVTVSVEAPSGGVQGWSFGLCHDQEAAALIWFRLSDELETIRNGRPPQYAVLEEAAGGGGLVQAVVLDYFVHRVLPTESEGAFPVLEVSYEADEETTLRICGGLSGSGQPVHNTITLDGASYLPQRVSTTTLVPKPQSWFSLSPEVGNGAVTAFIHSRDGGIQAWSLGLCHDPTKVDLARFSLSPELLTMNHQNGPDFAVCEDGQNGPVGGVVQAIVPSYYRRMELTGETEGGFPILQVEYDVREESSISFCDGLVGSGQPVEVVVTIDGESSRLPLQHAVSTLIVDPYSDTLAFQAEPPESSEVVTVKVYSHEAQVEGWSFSLCHKAEAAQVAEMQTSPELSRLVDGEPPEFVVNDVEVADPFVAVTQTVLLGTLLEPVALGPFPDGLAVLDVRYDVGAEENLKFCDHVGSIRLDNFVTIDGVRYVPKTRIASRLVLGDLGSRFIRGDADVSGQVNLTDAIVMLGYLFLGTEELNCMDAADVNDVARVDIADVIYLLSYLFLGGPEPRAPFPESGSDLSPETALGCERGL